MDVELTVEEAIKNITIASEMKDPYRVGIIKNCQLVLQDPEKEDPPGIWLTKGSSEELLEVMRRTFSCLTQYLKGLYKSDSVDWDHSNTRKGLQSMMVLVGDAAKKVNRFLKILEEGKKKPPKATNLAEYKILQEFYIDNITEKFTNAPPQGDEAWEEDADADSPVKDLESIRKDDAYELFYLKNIDNKPLFKRSLVKNMRLLFDFSENLDVPAGDDPLLEIVHMKDRDLQGSARQILKSLQPEVKKFYQWKIRLKKNDLISAVNSAIMSLMLASNEKNLASHTFNKNCLKYFLDFQYFFRKALTSLEYQKLLAYPPKETEQIPRFLVGFVQHIAYEFFTRSSSIRQEILGYIHRLIRKGEDLSEEKTKGSSVWEQMLSENEHVEALLRRYPSGPLFKILDALQEGEEKDQKFEPLQQENMPFLLFAMDIANKEGIHLLHLPTPTRQTSLAKVEISEEFSAFLAYLHGQDKEEQVHLLINLQDRTSWKENVRSTVLENLQKQAEYSKNITVLTLPKDTAFYYQTDEYEDMEKAEAFLFALKEQLAHPEDFGFFFSKTMEQNQVFFEKLLRLLHKNIFQNKKRLTKQERCDFIEIFYFFTVLKALKEETPDTVSFTCKDALDVGSMMSAGFFAFLQLLKKLPIKKEELDYLRVLIYAPVLMVRERAIDTRRLIRTLTAIDTLEKNSTEKGMRDIESLYGKGFFSKAAPRF